MARMTSDFLMPFSGNPLDRAGNLRDDAAWLAERMAAPESRFLLLSGLEVRTRRSASPELAWLDGSFRSVLQAPAEPVLLGLQDGVAHFAVDVTSLDDPISRLRLEETIFSEPRGLATTLPAGEAGILAQARSLLDWHARHRFCGTCGAETVPEKGGSSRG